MSPLLTLNQIVKLREHLLAIGWTRVYLSYKTTDFPWGKVTKWSFDRSYGSDVLPKGIHFEAEFDGITVLWDIKLEKPDHRGVMVVDEPEIRRAVTCVPSPVARELADALSVLVIAIKQRANDLQQAVNLAIMFHELSGG